ncbi:GlxA family transcriptional regulator [Gammaproteobacteria bacterium]|nr:GlxA family transcriptional regulator [Gammaproteobacteria bacterium]
MLAFSAAVEPLRLSNYLCEKELYRWSAISLNGESVEASNGFKMPVDTSTERFGDIDALFVVGGVDVDKHIHRDHLAVLRQFAKYKQPMGSLCTGSWALARADLLNGYRATIHWENLAAMREEFPEIVVSSELFEIDRDRVTCAGGVAAIDLMLAIVREEHGNALAGAVSEELLQERIRGRNDRQRVPLRLQLGTSQPKLIEAVSLMESNLEEPIGLDELSQHVGLSRRQLERLFQKHLQCVPTKYYLELRLRRARQLLLQTSKSIVDVAFACGFVSAPHFSKCYRDFFGIPPRDDRRMRGEQAATSPS